MAGLSREEFLLQEMYVENDLAFRRLHREDQEFLRTAERYVEPGSMDEVDRALAAKRLIGAAEAARRAGRSLETASGGNANLLLSMALKKCRNGSAGERRLLAAEEFFTFLAVFPAFKEFFSPFWLAGDMLRLSDVVCVVLAVLIFTGRAAGRGEEGLFETTGSRKKRGYRRWGAWEWALAAAAANGAIRWMLAVPFGWGIMRLRWLPVIGGSAVLAVIFHAVRMKRLRRRMGTDKR